MYLEEKLNIFKKKKKTKHVNQIMIKLVTWVKSWKIIQTLKFVTNEAAVTQELPRVYVKTMNQLV